MVVKVQTYAQNDLLESYKAWKIRPKVRQLLMLLFIY